MGWRWGMVPAGPAWEPSPHRAGIRGVRQPGRPGRGGDQARRRANGCADAQPWVRARGRDGTTVQARVANAPIREAEGRLLGLLGLTTDLSAQQQLERDRADLERARDAAQMAMRARARFLAVASHELRTPIGSLTG